MGKKVSSSASWHLSVLTMHTALIHRLLLPVFVLWVGGAVAVAAEIQIIDFEPVDTAGSAPFRSVST